MNGRSAVVSGSAEYKFLQATVVRHIRRRLRERRGSAPQPVCTAWSLAHGAPTALGLGHDLDEGDQLADTEQQCAGGVGLAQLAIHVSGDCRTVGAETWGAGTTVSPKTVAPSKFLAASAAMRRLPSAAVLI